MNKKDTNTEELIEQMYDCLPYKNICSKCGLRKTVYSHDYGNNEHFCAECLLHALEHEYAKFQQSFCVGGTQTQKKLCGSEKNL